MHVIVMIEIFGNNKKVNTLCTVIASHSYILPKCANTMEPKDEHCVLKCTYISYHICDPIPLDNLKNHTSLPYITWAHPGSQKYDREIPINKFYWTVIWDFKNKRKEKGKSPHKQATDKYRKKENLSCQIHYRNGFQNIKNKIRRVNCQIQSSGMS